MNTYKYVYTQCFFVDIFLWEKKKKTMKIESTYTKMSANRTEFVIEK